MANVHTECKAPGRCSCDCVTCQAAWHDAGNPYYSTKRLSHNLAQKAAELMPAQSDCPPNCTGEYCDKRQG